MCVIIFQLNLSFPAKEKCGQDFNHWSEMSDDTSVFKMVYLKWHMDCGCVLASFQWSKTHNQYIRQIHTNNFIGRKTQKKKVCVVQQTESTKKSGRQFSYWETRDKIRSGQCTLIQTAASKSFWDVFELPYRIMNKSALQEFGVKEQWCTRWFLRRCCKRGIVFSFLH